MLAMDCIVNRRAQMQTRMMAKLTVIIGVLLLIIAYIIPYDSLEGILGQGLRPVGLISIFINPILGVIGCAFSIYHKQWLLLVLNAILIFTFFIMIGMFGFV